jgi:hypothetical protein
VVIVAAASHLVSLFTVLIDVYEELSGIYSTIWYLCHITNKLSHISAAEA